MADVIEFTLRYLGDEELCLQFPIGGLGIIAKGAVLTLSKVEDANRLLELPGLFEVVKPDAVEEIVKEKVIPKVKDDPESTKIVEEAKDN